MISLFYRIYHFLGGITFALFLIATTAGFVVLGTFFESATDSHRYASQLTYGSSLFSLLLCGFFINILISALRRFPFKKRHFPFLITHLGMLMVLGGVLIKIYFGVQGTMTLLEGSGSDLLFLKEKPSLLIESKEALEPEFYTFNRDFSRHSVLTPLRSYTEPNEDTLTITLLDYAPNSYETVETLIKGDYTSIFNLQPSPVHASTFTYEELPLPSIVNLPQSKENPWNLLALATDSPESIAKKVYADIITVTLREIHSRELLYQGSLNQLLKNSEKFKARLNFSWTPLKGFDHPTLYVELREQEKEDKVAISLDGHEALLNRNAFPFLGKGLMTVDLNATPTLLLLKDLQNDVHVFAISRYGQVAFKKCCQGVLDNILAYDHGYLGYSQEIRIPYVENVFNRQMRELLFLDTMQSDRKREFSPEVLLSGYLRAYGMGLDLEHNFSLPSLLDLETQDSPLVLESPLSIRHKATSPSKKLENNIPCVFLHFKKGSREEVISLRYDPTGSGFKWPVLNGEYIVRFQPLLQKIPYRLRLRQARQINYPTSSQPFSYESDLIITDKSNNLAIESQISMNQVHETLDGYRFYLTEIFPADKGSLKRIHIVVNQDPAKYLLTYPGAFLMVLGIFMLFFRRKSYE